MNAILTPPLPETEYLMAGIPAPLVERYWPYCEPFIKRALDHASGEFTPDNFKQSCIDRDLQLWLISREKRIFGAITTEIVVYPNRKHCRVITLAGSDFSGWIELADRTLAQWSREQGCDAIESYVRKGLVAKLSPLGYVHKHCVVIKELSNE